MSTKICIQHNLCKTTYLVAAICSSSYGLVIIPPSAELLYWLSLVFLHQGRTHISSSHLDQITQTMESELTKVFIHSWMHQFNEFNKNNSTFLYIKTLYDMSRNFTKTNSIHLEPRSEYSFSLTPPILLLQERIYFSK